MLQLISAAFMWRGLAVIFVDSADGTEGSSFSILISRPKVGRIDEFVAGGAF